MTTVEIYVALFATTTLYAALLAWLQQALRLEPDLTWLEVIIGVTLCLLAPYFDQRWHGPLTSEGYEQKVWLAFIVGGLPIVVWQLSKSVRSRIQVERGLRDNATDQATAVAESRGRDSQTGD